MSGHLLSLSESQCYIAEYTTDQYDKREKNGKDDKHTPTDECMEINVGYQIALCAIFFGSQMAVEFEGLFGLLSMQYFGLPISLVSSSGFFSGVFSMIALPIIGTYSDKGTRPKRRKVIIEVIAMSILIFGYSLLIIISTIKNQQLEEFLKETQNKSNEFDSFDQPYYKYDNLNTTVVTPNEVSSLDFDSIPVIAILSVAVFAVNDIAFDMSLSLPRGLIVECVPVHQRIRVFTTGTSLAGLAGLVNGVFGLVNLPYYLSPIFNMDGMAATLILLGAILTFLTILTFGSTIFTVIILHFKNKRANEESKALISQETTKNKRLGLGFDHAHKHFRQQYDYGSIKEIKTLATENESSNDYDERSINESSLSISSIDHMRFKPSSGLEGNIIIPNESVEQTESIKYNSESNGQRVDKETPDNLSNEMCNSNNILSTKLCVRESQEKNKENEMGCKTFMGVPLHRHFLLTLVIAFFSFGVTLIASEYASNALTLEVYEGDPLALPGTPARDRYEEGIQMGAAGSFVLGFCYIITSFVNRKLLELIDNAVVFIVASLLLAGSTVLFYLLPSAPAFIFMECTVGIFKCMSHIIPFILGLKYFNPKTSSKDPEDSKKPQAVNAGRVTSLVGTLMPVHFSFASAFMGPLMQAAGNSWPPLLYMIGLTGANALACFLLIFI